MKLVLLLLGSAAEYETAIGSESPSIITEQAELTGLWSYRAFPAVPMSTANQLS